MSVIRERTYRYVIASMSIFSFTKNKTYKLRKNPMLILIANRILGRQTSLVAVGLGGQLSI